MNQCDGCKAGIRGMHRMGKEGPHAYPDLMFCEKYRYTPEYDAMFERDDAGNQIYVGGEPPVLTQEETIALDRFNTLKVKAENSVLSVAELRELTMLEVELGL